jgi:hypothetical protein
MKIRSRQDCDHRVVGRSVNRVLRTAWAALIALSVPGGWSRAEAENLTAASVNQMIDLLDKLDADVTVSLKPALPLAGPESTDFNIGDRTDAACNMQRFQMILTNDATQKSNKFAVLLNSQERGTAILPRQLFARTRILHVDADGSPRAYHPEDPNGKGVCTLSPGPSGGFFPTGVCALDTFASGGIRLIQMGRSLSGAELEMHWKGFWPLIRDKKILPSDVASITDHRPKKDYYAFHWSDKDLTVWFKKGIIPPTNDGYPCVRGAASHYRGYFVAATTLQHATDEDGGDGSDSNGIAPPECKALRNVNAELVPFFVLPGGNVGDVRIGDVVVVRARTKQGERLVYGIAADAGPTQSFGEASIALLQALLGSADTPVMNVAKVDALDIGSDRGITVDILVLGGTKAMLQGNYTRKNVEDVAQQEFAKWGAASASPMQRFNSCAAQVNSNP